MNKNKITKTHNKIVEILNNSDLKNNELVATLGQLLIHSGFSITNKKISKENLNWEELEKIYYSNNSDNDIGLGLILNGGSIMQAIQQNSDSTGDETALNKEKNDDQVSSTSEISQKSSPATS